MSWNCTIAIDGSGRVEKYALMCDGAPIAYADAMNSWQSDRAFRAYFNGLLADSSFTAFRWETPPVSVANADRPFEFVLLQSDGLVGRVDSKAFAEHYIGANSDVVTFQNLGGDATLVVPRPIGDESIYGHLASFVRNAPESQRDHFWRAVGNSMEKRLSEVPVWLSTAGYGVSWLHVRLDNRPKYYGYAPYKHFPGNLSQ